MKPAVITTWKVINLGTEPKTPDDFREALQDREWGISEGADDLLGQRGLVTSHQERKIALVVLTTQKILSRKEAARTQEVFAGAERLGLQKCPFEVGPQLCLQYPEQPANEILLIGMEPVFVSDGSLRIFVVGRVGGSRLLMSHRIRVAEFWGWGGGHHWVFVRGDKHSDSSSVPSKALPDRRAFCLRI